MKRIGFNIGRFGVYLFARQFWKYKSFFIVPGVTIDTVKGYDYYVDVEAKILCFGLGIRFIWVTKKK